MILFLISFAVSSTLFQACASDDLQFKTRPEKKVYIGADLSAVNMVEDYGAVYRDSNKAKDPFVIFRQYGCNLVRVRLFHNPDNPQGYSQWTKPGYCGLTDVEKTIRRAKEQGMVVCLDLHYSDTWADPAHQIIPLAWKDASLDVMCDSVYNYTLSVLNYYKSKNLTPEFIQIGNEINPGLLLPVGEGIENTAKLLNSGIKAVRDFSNTSGIDPKIIIHYADNTGMIYRMQTLIKAGVTDFDIFGVSYYDQWTSIKFADLAERIKTLVNTYKKEVMVVETYYQWTNTSNDGNVYREQIQTNGYPVTPDGQYNYVVDLTQTIIDAGGMGIIYWEPAWIRSSLSYGEETTTLFDYTGNTLKGINFMKYKY